MFFLDNDFLRVGYDDIEIGIIQGVQSSPSIFKKVNLNISVQHSCVLRWHNKSFVKGDYLTQRLQDGLVRRKDNRIMTKPLILWIFIRHEELVEDTSCHKDGFA